MDRKNEENLYIRKIFMNKDKHCLLNKQIIFLEKRKMAEIIERALQVY